MAALSDSSAIKKIALANSVMHAYRIKGGSQVSKLFFQVVISKFLKMKDGIPYQYIIKELGWELYVTKKRKAVSLLIHTFTGCTFAIKCYVEYTEHDLSSAIEGNKISKSVYRIELSSEVVYNAKNMALRHGYFNCEIDVAPRTDIIVPRPIAGGRLLKRNQLVIVQNASYSIPCENEEEIIALDFEAHLGVTFCDFKIRAQDSKILVHKALLAARSKFFREYFRKNEDETEIEIDAPPEAVNIVILFLYNGKMYAQPLETMLAVIELCSKLQIKTLQDLCVNFLKIQIGQTNAHRIREMAKKFGVKTLELAADRFLASDQDTWTANDL